MSLNIKIENFEGPFDLLLHLIKRNKMNIYDIKILDITNQYLEIIRAMSEMDLELTSEFIVTAATLIEIKSSMLLPKDKEEEEEDDENSTDNLIKKLVQYRKFKGAAEYLKNRATSFGQVYTKKPEIIEEKKGEVKLEELFKDVTMISLYNLFHQLMIAFSEKMNLHIIDKEIKIDLYKVEDKMEMFKEFFKVNKTMNFSSIVKGYTDKIEVVVAFLAALELAKLKEVKILQEDNFKEIYLERIAIGEDTEI